MKDVLHHLPSEMQGQHVTLNTSLGSQDYLVLEPRPV